MTSDADRIDAFFARERRWKAEMLALRGILQEAGLEEAWKWRQPVYTHAGGNIAMPAGFKDRCVLSFFKGVLLKDPEGVLVSPGENSRSAKVLPVADTAMIASLRPVMIAYLLEAMALQEAGASVDFPKDDLAPPEELVHRLDTDAELAEAFATLTPGRRRAWIMHIGQAKQAATRDARIDKARPLILAGKGLNGR